MVSIMLSCAVLLCDHFVCLCTQVVPEAMLHINRETVAALNRAGHSTHETLWLLYLKLLAVHVLSAIAATRTRYPDLGSYETLLYSDLEAQSAIAGTSAVGNATPASPTSAADAPGNQLDFVE